ncbi:MAG: hypothetical protein ACW9WZ_04145 [Nitrosopumilus sp.]
MGAKKKAGITLLFTGFAIFGFSQYVFLSQIGITLSESNLVFEDETVSKYSIELKFENPSLLYLSAGETDFVITANDEIIGNGKLDSFNLPLRNHSFVKGTFSTTGDSDSEDLVMKISGTTKYQILMSSIEVPFVYYPTDEQAREFLHH